jgi:catechol 2,3-dioxygenase
VSLPNETRISHVHLRIKNRERELSFYGEPLGFSEGESHDSTVALSSSLPANDGSKAAQPLFQILLTESPNAVPRPPRTAGLFHIAFRFPNRVGLATMLLRLMRNGYPMQGAADHLVSEAIYLADPEGNGIELYCDRSKDSWQWSNGEIVMATEPLDVEALLREAPEREWTDNRLLMDIGHIHLNVSSLTSAEEFYVRRLGFDVATRSYPGALFLSKDGYHHHIGVNVWAGRNAPRPPENSLGLIGFGIAMPKGVSRKLSDPDGIEVEITPTNTNE